MRDYRYARYGQTILLLLLMTSMQVPAAAPKVTKLQEGTRFSVSVPSRVSCNQVQAGAPFNCVVSAPVKVGNLVVIAQGATVQGSVVYARSSGVGFGGQLVCSLSRVQAADGSWLPMRVPAMRTHGADNILPDSFEGACTTFWVVPRMPSIRHMTLFTFG